MAKLEVHEKKYDILDAESNCAFRINIDVLNEAFGVGRAMYARASYPDKKGTFIRGTKPEEKYFVWMAKLYGNSSLWKNTLSSDKSYIYEIAEPGKECDWTDEYPESADEMRIAFVKDSPQAPYRFVGVYKNDCMKHMKHSYKRIATKIRLIGNPVFQIELLDEKR